MKTTIIWCGLTYGVVGLLKEIRQKKNWSNPFNASFKWVDGKIVMENWIFDPTSDITEAAAK